MFYLIKDGKKQQGFQVVLDNGYMVSVQFGAYAYCSNHIRFCNGGLEAVKDNESHTVGTAIIKPNGKFLKWQGDSVQSHQPNTKFLETINYANSLEPNNYGRVNKEANDV